MILIILNYFTHKIIVCFYIILFYYYYYEKRQYYIWTIQSTNRLIYSNNYEFNTLLTCDSIQNLMTMCIWCMANLNNEGFNPCCKFFIIKMHLYFIYPIIWYLLKGQHFLVYNVTKLHIFLRILYLYLN